MNAAKFWTTEGGEYYAVPEAMLKLVGGGEKRAGDCTPDDAVLVSAWDARKKCEVQHHAMRDMKCWKRALKHVTVGDRDVQPTTRVAEEALRTLPTYVHKAQLGWAKVHANPNTGYVSLSFTPMLTRRTVERLTQTVLQLLLIDVAGAVTNGVGARVAVSDVPSAVASIKRSLSNHGCCVLEA